MDTSTKKYSRRASPAQGKRTPTQDAMQTRKRAKSAADLPANGDDVELAPVLAETDAVGSPSFDAAREAHSAKGNKRKRLSVSFEAVDLGTEQSIAEVIKHHSKLVRRTAKVWVERYEKKPGAALIELLNSLFEVCGVDYRLGNTALDELDVDDVVVEVVKRAEEGPFEDYFGSRQKDLRSFKENLLLFWDSLVLECQNGPLFDGVLLDKCMNYVIALSCTPPRVFRQVTTLVGLQLVTSLITVGKTLGQSRETTQRQLNAEKKKKKEGPRMESLNRVLSETHGKITMAEEMMRKIFTGLFMHRYRDVDAEIRVACIQAIGFWIVSYPSLFLQDMYLKYIGWALNDKNPSVRKASITALQNLYEVDDNVPSLGLFTERFCARMIELADDIDVSVAVSAIGLLKHLLRHQLLGDEDLGPLYDLLIDESPLIRHAVGDLVYDHLIVQKFSSSQANESEDKGSELYLSRLLQILREFSSDPILSDYVIDAVWENMSAMKDWKCITSMLVDDNPKLELTDQDATHLVRVLCASAKKSVGEKIVPSAENRKVTLTKAQKESLENNKKELTNALIKTLPKLFRKYLADKAKVQHIVELIMYMDLELYNLKRQEQTFTQVLQLLKDAFFKHGEESALKACIKALTFCGTESQADLQDAAQQTMKLLEDELVLKLRTAIQQAGESDDDYSLTVSLRRLHVLQLSKAVSNDNLFTDLISLLESFSGLDDEVIQLTLLNVFLHVLWSLKDIDPENLTEAGMSLVISKRDNLIKQLETFGESVLQSYDQGNARSLLCCTICVVMSDLWSFFSESKLLGTKLQSLGFAPTVAQLQMFWKLCECRLNATDDSNEEEDVTDEHLDYLNQKDVVMSAAAKLIAHDLAPKDNLGPEIVSHFVLHGKTVAETVKHMLMILKKTMKPAELANLHLEAIKRAYNRHMREIQDKDEDWSTSQSFLASKELATRLSAMYSGSARNMYISSILHVVREGITHAFMDAPRQLPFLEGGILQFAMKLPPAEVQEILNMIEKKVEGVNTDEDPSSWRPYITFVDYLREKASRNVANDGDKVGMGGKPPHPSRKVHDLEGKRLFEGNETSDDEQPSESDEPNKHGDEDDDTPLIHARSGAKPSNLKGNKGDASSTIRTRVGNLDDSSGPYPGMYNNSLFGSASEEQLPAYNVK